MFRIAEFIKEFNRRNKWAGLMHFDEPLAAHTTFKTGGPADLWIQPEGEIFPAYAGSLVLEARKEGIPLFILGGGANLVVSKTGIRGIVLDSGGWTGPESPRREDSAETVSEEVPGLENAARPTARERLFFRSGTPVDAALEYAAGLGLSGLEFLAGMPGSLGGAIWMNARCYDREISETLESCEILDFSRLDRGEKPERKRFSCKKEDFAYKKSPFQNMDTLILGGTFVFESKNEAAIRCEMEEHKKDRGEKGQYCFPSAGSVFKNNREFGKPAGKIIDEAGLKGLSLGDAQVAPWHGNCIINRGAASGEEIKALAETVREKVCEKFGLEMEFEVIFAGFAQNG